ncbi:MAG: HvfC/BufC N-terminal domain-containing protein [Methyloligellaceae bacterium]
MPRLADLQRDFARSVLDADSAVPDGVTSHTGHRPKRRFDVYRNNVYVSLIDVLSGRFPVVLRLVGEEFFRAMARCYVEAEPPRSPVLMEYGGGFPSFLETFEPARELPYLPDVARLEQAWNAAYHAGDAEPVGSDALMGVTADDIPHLTFEFLPSLELVRSPYPIVSIWETNTADVDVEPVDLAVGGEDALVIRPHLEVEVRRLPEGASDFISALRAGRRLGEAFELAQAESTGFDLQANIAGLVASGSIAGFCVAADADD